MSLQKKSSKAGLIFISIWLFGLITLKLGPFLISFVLSFTDYSLIKKPNFIGIQNYINMFQDPVFYISLKATFLYVFFTVPVQLSFALFVANILNYNIRGVNFFRTAYYIPSILGGSIAVSILWKFLFSKVGFINIFLSYFSIPPIEWLSDPNIAIYTISLLRVWQFGSSMVIFLAALQNVPKDLYEAATIEGASKWTVFTRITIPIISPVIFFNFILQLINAFQEFNSPYLITQGGPLNSTNLLSLLIYTNAFGFYKMGYASAISWFLFIIIMIFTLLIFKTQKNWVHYAD